VAVPVRLHLCLGRRRARCGGRALTKTSLRQDFSIQALWQGLLVALVGYASSVAVVIQGLAAVGASVTQIASGLVVLGIAKGIVAIAASWWTRMPISIAWTTPGLALLATIGTVSGGFPAAVGAFIAVGLLIMLTGLWTPLGRLVAAIPKPIASAMLAGILLKLCLAPFMAIGKAPWLAAAVLATWLLVHRVARGYAVPAAVIVALAGMAFDRPFAGIAFADLVPRLEFVMPVFTFEAMLNIALPLFIVTMAGQNLPGLTVLAAFDYRPRVAPLFLSTGAASALGAPLGMPTINLAAITAALCAGPDAHADPSRRYVAGIFGGVGYVALAALAGVAAVLVARSPPVLIEAVAGLALIGAFGGAMLQAVQEEDGRLPGLITFLTTASGFALFGVGSAFWGLVLGLIAHQLFRARRSKAA
jgi:benzoate membrane transport protein